MAIKGPLEQACIHHKNGNLAEASKLYISSIYNDFKCGKVTSLAFQNLGAISSKNNNSREAEFLYSIGLRFFPNNTDLLSNLAGVQLNEGKNIESLYHIFRAFTSYSSRNVRIPTNLFKLYASSLWDAGLFSQSLQVLKNIFDAEPDNVSVGLHLIDCSITLEHEYDLQLLDSYISTFNKLALSDQFTLCNILLSLDKFDDAINLFDKHIVLDKVQPDLPPGHPDLIKYHTTCWNFSLQLLRKGHLKRGWELFDHGRYVPNGIGGKQRTMMKAFPKTILPEWDGSPLEGRSILIYGEQGIGDVMMFSMLLGPLYTSASKLGLITYDRLLPIYKRSFPSAEVYDPVAIRKGLLKADDWDYQFAIGSIPEILFPNIDNYKTLNPWISENKTIRGLLKPALSQTKLLIGFSWRGGGNTKQKRTKSITLEDLLPLFTIENTQWINLQYGDHHEELSNFSSTHGLDIISHADVNPLTDMDTWTSLVSLCDVVVSVANTTIHASGGLGIPTYVLRAKDPDWRWISASDSCYWYPSVRVCKQSDDLSWSSAVSEVRSSLLNYQRDRISLVNQMS